MQTLSSSFPCPSLSALPQGRVLIVDDEANVTLLLKRSLARLGSKLEVQVANSGSQALDVLDGQQLDLLITDYQMRNMNGLNLIKSVRRRYPEVKVILMTAYPSQELADLADSLAVDCCLTKPFSARYLRQLVRGLLTLS